MSQPRAKWQDVMLILAGVLFVSLALIPGAALYLAESRPRTCSTLRVATIGECDFQGYCGTLLDDGTKRRWFGCSRGDAIGWDFTATNALGQPVQGIACCGAMKACTVRF